MQDSNILVYSGKSESKNDKKISTTSSIINTASILPRRTNVWVDDNSVDNCYKCNQKFTWYYRRHHCRGCGRVFCYDCCKHTINAYEVNSCNLIDHDKYLIDCMRPKGIKIAYRACFECMRTFKKIEDLSKLITIFELLPLEVIKFHALRRVNRTWHEASNILLSRFREIQYNLPNHKYNLCENKLLFTNKHLFAGHNILVNQFIKSFNWDSLSKTEINNYLRSLRINKQNTPCWKLMCCRECNNTLSDSEAIDVLLHVQNPIVRELMLNYLNKDHNIIECYVPILTYAIRLDENTHRYGLDHYTVRDYLIDLCVESERIRHRFYWELLVQLEEPQYNAIYRETMELLIPVIEKKLGASALTNITDGMKLINSFTKICLDPTGLDQLLLNRFIVNNIYEKDIPMPMKPDVIISGVDFPKVRIMKSATSPVMVPCKVKGSEQSYSFIYKSEDIRKDHLICCIIRIMDSILKSNGLDMNIVTYNILPTSMNSGLIEIVPNSETLYNIKERDGRSIQNHIMEHNGDLSTDVWRDRFLKSTAAYCVITYLLGIGDRHMDNIMVTTDGRLFHIDYSFVLGLDPKPMAPKMRITEEMIDALGSVKGRHYKAFEGYCTDVYNILRRHANLFTNMLFLLTKISHSRFTEEQLEIEVGKRFLPGELRSQAKVQLIKTINSSTASTNLIDFFHYQYKEHWKGTRIYEAATGLVSRINPFG